MITRFLLLISIISCMACVNDISEIDELFVELDSRVEVGKDIEILYSDSAFVRVRLTAPTIRRHINKAQPRDEFPDGLFVEFLDRDGRVESTLQADRGDRYPRLNKMIVHQNVIAKNSLGEVLETSELVWNDRDQKATTTRFVTITKAEEIITAFGFEATNNFSNYQLYSVQGRKRVEDMENEIKN